MRHLLSLLRAPFFSTTGFLVRAIGLFALYGVLHLAGLREYTSFISGTTVAGDSAHLLRDLAGITYFATYSLALP